MKTKQRWLQFVAFVLALIAFPQLVSAQYPHETILNNGDPRTRIDIVIVGDGYTAAQMNQYHADAQALVQYMLSQQPFTEYQRYFNVHRIDVVSAESGADHPGAPGDGSCGYEPDFYHTPKPGICRNTALDASYGPNGPYDRFLHVNSTTVNNIVVSTLQPAQYDLTVAVVNDPIYGGSGGGNIAVMSVGNWDGMLHEMGHSLAFLGDEYTTLGATSGCNQYQSYPENIETERNVFPFFGQGSSQYIKWRVWIDSTTPIATPTNSQYQNAVPGAFQGADVNCLDLYRPTFDSKMRSYGRPFEQINTEQLVRRFYDYVRLPDASQPASNTIIAQQGQVEKFAVSVPIPLTHSLYINWYIDGSSIPAGTGQFFALDTNHLTPGSSHSVTVDVSDPTQFVRRYFLLQERTWNVTITNPPQRPNPIDDQQTFVKQQYLDFLDRQPDQGGWDYWTSQITQCGTDAACISARRTDVSAAFFVEQEFQQTGYYVYRFYKASYGSRPPFSQFMPLRTTLADTVDLEASKMAFANNWIARDEFKQAYPESLTNDQFVNQLYNTAQLTPYTTERQQEIQDMNNGKTRAQVLRDVVEIAEFKNREYNPAFVLMEYFGYLRRDPDETGYQFWVDNLNHFNNIHGMVDAFVTSAEYRARFGDAAPPSSTSVTFIQRDTTTQGNWSGIYGTDGYNVINDTVSYPSYVQVAASGQSSYTWANSTGDVRALRRANSSNRIAAQWYSGTSFSADINFTDNQSHQVAVYLLDWDSCGSRTERVDVIDAVTGSVLDSTEVGSFISGQYLVWNIRGHVLIRITKLTGCNATMSGLFFAHAV